MKDICAVLFDMDGLLIDDERINIGSCCEMAEIMGFTIDPLDIARHCMGATRETVIDCYRAILPADVDVNAFLEAKNKLLLKHFEELGFPPMKGAEELLSWLHLHGIACVLATSSGMDKVEARLGSAGLAHLLDHIVTGDMVTHSKPDPEIYLKAAAKADAPIEKCLVLEDSYNGVRAGRASGAVVGMVPDTLPFDDTCAPHVDFVFDSLRDVIDWLQAD